MTRARREMLQSTSSAVLWRALCPPRPRRGGNVTTLGADPTQAALQSQVNQAMLLQSQAAQFPDAPNALKWLTDSYLLLLDTQKKAIAAGMDSFGEITGELIDRTEQAVEDIGGAANKTIGGLVDNSIRATSPFTNMVTYLGLGLIVGVVVIASGGGAQSALTVLASRRVTL
jgi:hypothetical protein